MKFICLGGTLAVILFPTAVIGCSSGSGAHCVPGQSDTCPCANGQAGSQVCLADGDYGACNCSTPPAGAATAAAASPAGDGAAPGNETPQGADTDGASGGETLVGAGGDGSAPDPVCAQECAAEEQVPCAGAPSESACVAHCESIRAGRGSCLSLDTAFRNCFSAGPIVCAPNGRVVSTCQAQAAALQACTGPAGASDASSSASSTAPCAAESNAFQACVNAQASAIQTCLGRGPDASSDSGPCSPASCTAQANALQNCLASTAPDSSSASGGTSCSCSCTCSSCTSSVTSRCSPGSTDCSSCSAICQRTCSQDPMCGSFIAGSGTCS